MADTNPTPAPNGPPLSKGRAARRLSLQVAQIALSTFDPRAGYGWSKWHSAEKIVAPIVIGR